MNPPTTHAAWCECLERLATGTQDQFVLAAMCAGRLDGMPGSTRMFSEQMSLVFRQRLAACNDRLMRDLRRGADQATVVRATVNARLTLGLLHRFSEIAAFPSPLRERLSDDLQRCAERAQAALEDSARVDRSGHLASLFRSNSLLGYKAAPDSDTALVGGMAVPPGDSAFAARSGRRGDLSA